MANRSSLGFGISSLTRALLGFTAQDYALAYFNRDVPYSDLGQYENAIDNYTKAIQLDPDYAKAYLNRGNAYDDLDQYQRAIQDYDKAIQLDPDNAFAYLNRGAAYEHLGQYATALEDYDKAIQLDPDDAMACFNRGISYHQLSGYATAIDNYTKAIQLDLDYATAYFNRGYSYRMLGHDEKADADKAKACSFWSFSPNLFPIMETGQFALCVKCHRCWVIGLGYGREPSPNFSTRRFKEWASTSSCNVPSYMVWIHGAYDGRAKIRMTNGISQ